MVKICQQGPLLSRLGIRRLQRVYLRALTILHGTRAHMSHLWSLKWSQKPSKEPISLKSKLRNYFRIAVSNLIFFWISTPSLAFAAKKSQKVIKIWQIDSEDNNQIILKADLDLLDFWPSFWPKSLPHLLFCLFYPLLLPELIHKTSACLKQIYKVFLHFI